MPGLRFLSLSEMQRSSCSKSEQKKLRFSEKRAAVRNFRNLSKRAKPAPGINDFKNELVLKNSRRIHVLPGSLIHLSQSADGKLCWDPPASTSHSESAAHSDCFSAECGTTAVVGSTSMRSEGAKAFKKQSPTESSKVEHMSPSLTSLSLCVTSDSSIICSADTGGNSDMQVDTGENSDIQEVSLGSQQPVTSSSELSAVLLQHEVEARRLPHAGVLGPVSSRICGLSPYLSSKLKPGRHILGVKKQQNFIRPGQLRHWAVGANFPGTSLKGKACRTLAF